MCGLSLLTVTVMAGAQTTQTTRPSNAAATPRGAMPNLLLPPWPPTYNLTQSTMTQSCFGPARISPVGPLTNQSGSFMRHWGIVTIDFESQEKLWAQSPNGKNSDEMMLAEAVKAKAIAPDTKIYVYRNLAQAYSNFVELRAKIEDPAYAGWFLPFGPESTLPRCEVNPRINKTLCSDLFHAKSGWTEDGHDCGDHIPCGDYVFDHRNQSLREWLVTTHILGPMGLGHPAVDGFLIDDWYTKAPCTPDSTYPCTLGEFIYGPSEIEGFIGAGSGIGANSTEMAELYGNWSITTTQALAAIRARGGFTWSNFNCMLDTDNGCVDVAAPSDPARVHSVTVVIFIGTRAHRPTWPGAGFTRPRGCPVLTTLRARRCGTADSSGGIPARHVGTGPEQHAAQPRCSPRSPLNSRLETTRTETSRSFCSPVGSTGTWATGGTAVSMVHPRQQPLITTLANRSGFVPRALGTCSPGYGPRRRFTLTATR